MKNFLLIIFLFLSATINAMSEEVEINLKCIYNLFDQNEWDLAIEELTSLIEDENVTNIDRVHYLWRRAHVFGMFHDYNNYTNDINLIRKIIKNDDKCKEEVFKYYEFS